MQTTEIPKAGERTQRIVSMIDELERLLSDDQDTRNTLAAQMSENQSLPTSAERIEAGFAALYGSLERVKFTIGKLQDARFSLLATI